jgi:hypothetical protein
MRWFGERSRKPQCPYGVTRLITNIARGPTGNAPTAQVHAINANIGD